jgi:hypothetical protein
VPEHFYAEVLALIGRQTVVTGVLDEGKGRDALADFGLGASTGQPSIPLSIDPGRTATT